jgi:hypothetical protein
VVVVERGRSQWQNLKETQSALAQRLLESAQLEASERLSADRNRQIASGERPVERFTHNEKRPLVEAHAERQGVDGQVVGLVADELPAGRAPPDDPDLIRLSWRGSLGDLLRKPSLLIRPNFVG